MRYLLIFFICFGYSQGKIDGVLEEKLKYNYEFDRAINDIQRSYVDDIIKDVRNEINALRIEIDSLKREIDLLKAINEIQGDAIKIFWQDKNYKIKQDSLRDAVNFKRDIRQQREINVLHQKQ